MANIDPINPTDQINTSRTKINANFDALNADATNAQSDILARATQVQVQNASLLYAADSGAKNALVVTLSPTPSAYVTGMAVRTKVAVTNDAAATINVNGLGAKAIKKNHDQDLAAGDLEAGQVVDLVYDGSVFQMQSQVATTQSLSFATLNPQQGFLINGKIVTSVASNNLTVALKTLAGTDPSGSDPVYVRIGNSVRSITSALSLTLNAGTNYFNAGGSELATQEIDYFVYLGYRASNTSVFIGFARISHGRVYSDFNSTSTDEKYLPFSGSAPTGTDEVEVVGRFNAVLSAGASYNWSIPGTSIVISRPVYETRWLVWTPVWGGYSAAPTSVAAKYMVRPFEMRAYKDINSGAGTSNTTDNTMTMPFKALVDMLAMGYGKDNGANLSTLIELTMGAGSRTLNAYKGFHATAWTNSGAKDLYLPIVNIPI